ncbi:hypothetical protein B4N89_34570 [Embleya scabrispora]|uniref:DUF397 domain-containing protein n=1 Tax=Embleya scabrispora TaxID=159449 RepID=A0A1T3NR26_9ACTN|nr:DUF397 domain-containing protein [Embleya scabrispora]OPC79195.1 hypothetical protein B4N89_34570 [Embleya scabrispora]
MTTSEWFKSSYSNPDVNCVEGARSPGHAIAIRDSQEPTKGTCLFREATWTPFLTALKTTEPPAHT